MEVRSFSTPLHSIVFAPIFCPLCSPGPSSVLNIIQVSFFGPPISALTLVSPWASLFPLLGTFFFWCHTSILHLLICMHEDEIHTILQEFLHRLSFMNQINIHRCSFFFGPSYHLETRSYVNASPRPLSFFFFFCMMLLVPSIQQLSLLSVTNKNKKNPITLVKSYIHSRWLSLCQLSLYRIISVVLFYFFTCVYSIVRTIIKVFFFFFPLTLFASSECLPVSIAMVGSLSDEATGADAF